MSTSILLPKFKDKLTLFGLTTLKDRYLLEGEEPDGLVERVSRAFQEDEEHGDRISEYIKKMWLMPSTPILSNGGTKRGLPISCFLSTCEDSLSGIIELWKEIAFLASKGGGIGIEWSKVRSIGENIGISGKTSGIIPFIKVSDSLTLAISQGSLRRGSMASFLRVDHPEIEEFIEIRRPTGGDQNRRCLNIHNGVCITNDFMEAVDKDLDWDLISPKTKKVLSTVSARSIWIKILTARLEIGEPYLIFLDNINDNVPEIYKKNQLNVTTSNLCSEIVLHTGLDYNDKSRIAVCCLTALNLEYYDQWKDNKQIIKDALLFLDNVLQYFIDNAPPEMEKAIYSASMERSIGLGAMGWHSYLQKNKLAFGDVAAKMINKDIFKHIRTEADKASKEIAETKGSCKDGERAGIVERFTHKMAVAPTASISIICGETSPGIEPITANIYTQKTLSGSFRVVNKYLKQLLEEKGYYNEDILSEIGINKGSVQSLDVLTDREKEIFKTGYEIDQMHIIEHAANRTPYICQAQSVNLYLPANVTKELLHFIHFKAWKLGLKSLYYCRSTAIVRADKDTDENYDENSPENKYDECLSCQ